MGYVSKVKKTVEQIKSLADRIGAIFKIILSSVIFCAIVFCIFRFQVISRVWELEIDGPKYLGQLFIYACIGVVILFCMSSILDGIGSLLAISRNSLNNPARLLLLFSCIVFNCFFLFVGGLFIYFGAITVTVSTLTAGLILELMGLACASVGVFNIYCNSIYYASTVDGNVDLESPRCRKIAIVEKNLIPCIGGAVFCLVPVVIIVAVLNTPEMTGSTLLAGIFMGLIFAALGVYILVCRVKKIKKEISDLQE